MSAIVQQFTSDDTVIPIPNDIHTSITKLTVFFIGLSNIDQSLQKLALWVSPLE